MSETFTYDGFGRLIQDSRGTYTYRPDGALLTATARDVPASYTASYLYDANGLRVRTNVNGRRQISVRGLGGLVLSEFESVCDGALVWQRDLIYAGSRLLGSVKNATPRPAVAFAAATSSVAEPVGSGLVSVAVQLTTPAPLACPVSVSYQTGNVTSGSRRWRV